jgi:hypothetical protein
VIAVDELAAGFNRLPGKLVVAHCPHAAAKTISCFDDPDFRTVSRKVACGRQSREACAYNYHSSSAEH